MSVKEILEEIPKLSDADRDLVWKKLEETDSFDSALNEGVDLGVWDRLREEAEKEIRTGKSFRCP